MPKTVSFDTADHVYTTYSPDEYDRSYFAYLCQPCLDFTFFSEVEPLGDKQTMCSPELIPHNKRNKPRLSINTHTLTGPSFFTQLSTHYKEEEEEAGYLIPAY
ncbi:hypothetical protein BY458DRAFT_520574 [Sporodiniella umbellata]|nr:hypothetical protein BY458DRAFT_520574 [Sporodiniella umbellata]